MPLGDINITLLVERPDMKRQFSVTMRIPGNGNPGVTIPAAARTKIGDTLERLITVVDQDRSDL